MIEERAAQSTQEVHRANLLKSLERRLELAKEKGQRELINHLEAEKRYYLK